MKFVGCCEFSLQQLEAIVNVAREPSCTSFVPHAAQNSVTRFRLHSLFDSSLLAATLEMAKEIFSERMRGREILRSLSAVELLLLAVWCLLGLLFKQVNEGFAVVDGILGNRFERYRIACGG